MARDDDGGGGGGGGDDERAGGRPPAPAGEAGTAAGSAAAGTHARAPPPPLAATMLGSALSGMLARLPCHPLDTVKARLQVQTRGGARAYTGVVSGMAAIIRSEGVAGLYRGFWVTMLGSAPAGMLYFTSYEVAKAALAPVLAPGAAAFSAGMAAEAVSCLLWVPIDVIKERMQVQSRAAPPGSPFYRNTADAVRQILRNEGLAGVYRGYGATLASFGPFSALYFLLYESMKTAVAGTMPPAAPGAAAMLPFGWQMATACTAGGVAAWLTSPLDLAKLRLQVQRGLVATHGAGDGAPPPFAYRNLLHGLRTIVATEGAAALFRGAGARVAYHAPATAITMTLFERCKDASATFLAWAYAPPPSLA